mmetsp:Transcript_57214/g.134672  ORF Transcript_57214/g.134672 Transcript_57214/m.134672 type:complete len:267 (+) Transcript_57214:3-803(+)
MEVMVAKEFPMSWVQNWIDWLNFDNGRGEGGTPLTNRKVTRAILADCMIAPTASWTSDPINMVNYYGIGRLGWDLNLTADDIHDEWARLTFPTMSNASLAKIHQLLSTSQRAARELMEYHGYRGVWFKWDGDKLESNPLDDMTINKTNIGAPGDTNNLTASYSAGAQEVYRNRTDPRTEEVLLVWERFPYDHKLSSGLTIAQDIPDQLAKGVADAAAMVETWTSVKDEVDFARYNWTLTTLQHFASTALDQQHKVNKFFEKLLGDD